MPLHRTKFTVRVSGASRLLFTVIEKENGEIILATENAGRDKERQSAILEQRFSIHPSPRSLTYTTVKRTQNTADGHTATSVMLTDAVKRKNGFALVLVRRVQDLRPAKYKIAITKECERGYVLGEYDPAHYTFYLGLFLGHPDVNFDARVPQGVVHEFRFKRFKLVLLETLLETPSHSSTQYGTAVTLDPDNLSLTSTEDGKELLRSFMSGKNPEVCVRQYLRTMMTLIKNFWEMVLPELDGEEQIRYAKDWIEAASGGNVAELGLGKGPLLTHLPTGVTLPKFQ